MAVVVPFLLLVVTGCLAAPFDLMTKDDDQFQKLEKILDERIGQISASTTRLGNQMENMKNKMRNLEKEMEDLKKQEKGKDGLKGQNTSMGGRPSSRQNPPPPPPPRAPHGGRDSLAQVPIFGRNSRPGPRYPPRQGAGDMRGGNDEQQSDGSPITKGLNFFSNFFPSLFSG
ncbi:uncharacterized protein LOC144878058 [Branchiostoma floridae x Branchiostoma japonicum]